MPIRSTSGSRFAKSLHRENAHLCRRVAPSTRRQARLHRTAIRKELFSRPTLVHCHLRKEAARPLTQPHDNSVPPRNQLPDVTQGEGLGKNRKLDGQSVEFFERNRVVTKTRISQRSATHLLDAVEQILAGRHRPNAAPKPSACPERHKQSSHRPRLTAGHPDDAAPVL